MASKEFHHKIVMDPVHGTIGLSKLESEIAGTRAFQRLHNVRQLGLAHLVFPGASYSRYSHSVGACYNAGKIIKAIRRNSGSKKIDNKTERKLRLAALLHDVGHYPFSHATEHLIKEFYQNRNAGSMIGPSGEQGVDTSLISPAETPIRPMESTNKPYFDHEKVGEILIENDEEISKVLDDNKFDKNEFLALFGKKAPNEFIGIISSDLDCDRLDYLRRTAHNSGAPYGSVDINYIISQAAIEKKTYCFTEKARKAADHLLVSRYYDYMQVPFNKTVVALEWSLISCIEALLQEDLDLSASKVKEMIASGEWSNFDDQHLFEQFRKKNKEIKDKLDEDSLVLKDHVGAILNRKAPKLVCGWDSIDSKSESMHAKKSDNVKKACEEVIKEMGLNKNRVHIWSTSLPLTKFGGKADYSQPEDDYTLSNAVKFIKERGDPGIITNYDDTLMSKLGDIQYSGVRFYYLPKNGVDDEKIKNDIKSKMKKKMVHLS
ncbi:HD domain-containing protein [Nitrospirillum viridazoti]|uniref:HD domain-containing protein n=1 Tax=Nitrospirillum amazonense TaxID=28077 RepID=A0A560J1C8_9PROT|nr:HD domain-containing protein [Nitrospirillum amazonense]TWB64239.1 hypothetical protein FBZ92_101132 [Nitrospirillum amazonense]